MKNSWKKLIAKSYVVGTGAFLTLSPQVTEAAGTAPSTYVNSISNGILGEILAVAPNLALVVIALALVMYFCSNDDHKKGKYKGTAFVAIGCYLLLLVLQPLLGWFQGLV